MKVCSFNLFPTRQYCDQCIALLLIGALIDDRLQRTVALMQCTGPVINSGPVKTTQVYTKVVPVDLKKTHNQTHPGTGGRNNENP